jgi:16S rRNA C967 or C1407 C5-methylase (RsmB/RsmF family)
LGDAGQVFAFEKDQRRFILLNNTIVKYSAKNISSTHCDFLSISPGDEYKKVKFILLDPSCSGSGMLTNFTRDNQINSLNENLTNEPFENFCIKKYE